MGTINESGPAFPTIARKEQRSGSGNASVHYEVHVPAHDGMSLRDYFAAKALAGIVADQNVTLGGDGVKQVARLAYALADAMLESREVE